MSDNSEQVSFFRVNLLLRGITQKEHQSQPLIIFYTMAGFAQGKVVNISQSKNWR